MGMVWKQKQKQKEKLQKGVLWKLKRRGDGGTGFNIREVGAREVREIKERPLYGGEKNVRGNPVARIPLLRGSYGGFGQSPKSPSILHLPFCGM